MLHLYMVSSCFHNVIPVHYYQGSHSPLLNLKITLYIDHLQKLTWFRSNHPPTQRNLRGGRLSSVEKIKKSKKLSFSPRQIVLPFSFLFVATRKKREFCTRNTYCLLHMKLCQKIAGLKKLFFFYV